MNKIEINIKPTGNDGTEKYSKWNEKFARGIQRQIQAEELVNFVISIVFNFEEQIDEKVEDWGELTGPVEHHKVGTCIVDTLDERKKQRKYLKQ